VEIHRFNLWISTGIQPRHPSDDGKEKPTADIQAIRESSLALLPARRPLPARSLSTSSGCCLREAPLFAPRTSGKPLSPRCSAPWPLEVGLSRQVMLSTGEGQPPQSQFMLQYFSQRCSNRAKLCYPTPQPVRLIKANVVRLMIKINHRQHPLAPCCTLGKYPALAVEIQVYPITTLLLPGWQGCSAGSGYRSQESCCDLPYGGGLSNHDTMLHHGCPLPHKIDYFHLYRSGLGRDARRFKKDVASRQWRGSWRRGPCYWLSITIREE